MAAREERRKYGQSLRQKVGRVSHADWDPKHRKVSILELLRASERGRLANLRFGHASNGANSQSGILAGGGRNHRETIQSRRLADLVCEKTVWKRKELA
jgi:hypothetical protein